MAKKSFDMPTLRRRARKMMRVRHKKRIKLTDLDAVWNDYVELCVLKPLIKYGEAEADKGFKLEIIAKDVLKDNRLYSLISKGLLSYKSGGVARVTNMNKNRLGYVYKIALKQSNYKGIAIFQADSKIKSAVTRHLVESNQYYKVQ